MCYRSAVHNELWKADLWPAGDQTPNHGTLDDPAFRHHDERPAAGGQTGCKRL